MDNSFPAFASRNALFTTGSGSTVLVLTLLGLVSGQDVRVRVRGGILRVTVDLDGNQIQNLWLTGPTNMVCEGKITDETLNLLISKTNTEQI